MGKYFFSRGGGGCGEVDYEGGFRKEVERLGGLGSRVAKGTNFYGISLQIGCFLSSTAFKMDEFGEKTVPSPRGWSVGGGMLMKERRFFFLVKNSFLY